MEKVTISITYNVKLMFKEHYVLTTCNKIINVKKGIIVKQFYRGSKLAFYCNGVVMLVEDIKPMDRVNCPF
jgi:hypothetical protein